MWRALSLTAALLVLWAFLPSGLPAAAAQRAASSGFSASKTVTRDHLVGGVTTTVDTRNVSLSVSTTQDLRGLQEIEVSWTGARPTGGAVQDANDGRQGIGLEYPMVLLECRGVDSPDAQPDQRLDPTTCWTAYAGAERLAVEAVGVGSGTVGFPPWRLDVYATAAQREPVVGVPTDPSAVLARSNPPTTVGAALADPNCHRNPIEYWLPLRAADGSVYYPAGGSGSPEPCGGFPQPSEGLDTSPLGALTFPSNETYAVTAVDGKGSAKFDVLTANENATLGCSDTVPCALVAIPIMGIGCDAAAAGLPPEDVPPTSTASQAEATCEASGRSAPGVGGSIPDVAVSGRLWWAASNWRNRITVPLSFAPVHDACAITGGGKSEVDIYGSEAMTEAASQWDPHFCLDPSLFTLKHVATPEPVARNILAKGNTVAAYSTYDPPGTYNGPVVNAPVAITGFAVSFAIDDDQQHEVANLRLNARLLAKLLTESYPVDPSFVQPGDPGLQHNPFNLLSDPEFAALNPQIFPPTTAQNVPFHGKVVGAGYGVDGAPAGVLYALSSDSDVMYALTSYIMNDPEARAWLNGTPDPWGMVVNPHYNLAAASPEISLPTQSWLLLDTFLSGAGQLVTLTPSGTPVQCPDLGASPMLGLVAAPASQMVRIAQAVEFAWPLSTARCSGGEVNQHTNIAVEQLARDLRQPPGERFILGVTSLGESARYGLNTASLETSAASAVPGQFTPPDQRSFVAPNNASLRAATSLLTPDPATQTWQLPANLETTPSAAGAYPGTMVVNTEVPTTGLSSTDAGNLAKFLRFAAGPGQQPGSGVGQLPAGYLPMTSANGAGALVNYTSAAADAVAAQSGGAPPVPGTPPSPGPTGSSQAQEKTGGSGGSPTTSSSPSSSGSSDTTATASQTTSGGPGSLSAIGPSLRTVNGGGGSAPPPVAAGDNGPVGILGKTIAILSAAGSLLRWLVYIALAALLAAAALYAVVVRRSRGSMSPRGLVEFLSGLLSRIVARLAALLRPCR